MTAWPDGYDRVVLDEVDSTNAEAVRRAPGLSGPTWIMARSQTAARGRRGRAWAMPPGNFAATLVLHPDEPPETVALRSFVAALALFDALVAVTGRAEILALKWPNDVLLNGGKLAGILLESLGHGRGVSHLAIGIGVNLTAAPGAETLERNAARPVALGDETGTSVTPETFLTSLAEAYAAWENRFATFGFAPIREAWLARAAKLGEHIVARTSDAEITGVFETIDKTGALVLGTAGGRVAIPAADIYFQRGP
ncbi:MAG: biotin--[acetyl-CoA-carboxylase] ligase [Rhodobacter sp.]|nr:biotin--[acetyl-CoA-carboxylase] ligase [Rhodobacter sp.]